MRHTSIVWMGLPLLIFMGCMGPTEGDESSDTQFASFMSALTAEFGLSEQSPEVIELLAMVNSATFEQLDLDAGLNARAARHIIAHRNGPDGVEASADDNLFETLLELDEVPYVGPAALERLLAYAATDAWHPEAPSPELPAELSAAEHVAQVEEQLMLEVVNTSDLETLDEVVGLNKLAAEAIMETRAGFDGFVGSGDDVIIDSLETLDAVPYVGVHALNTLRSYVLSSGLLAETLAAQAAALAAAESAAAALPEQAMIEAANHASLEELDIFAALDQRAANAIVNHRQGPDGRAGNDDDGWFGSRDDIDAVRWVGDSALAKLEAYAMEAGHLPPTWTEGWSHDRVRVRFDIPLRRHWHFTNPPAGYERTIMVCDVNIRSGRVLCRRGSNRTAQCSGSVGSCYDVCEATEEEFQDFESGNYQYNWYDTNEFYSCYDCWDPHSPDCQSPCTPALAGDITAEGSLSLAYERTSNFNTYREFVELEFGPNTSVSLASYRHEYRYEQSTPHGTALTIRDWWNCGDTAITPFAILPR